MSSEQFDKYVDDNNQSMVSTKVFLYCQDPYAVEYSILDYINEEGYTGIVTNAQFLEDTTETSLTLISIFAFGFIAVIILVGITNIFNSLSANMKLRKKEFAMLQSIGVPLGSIISYVISYLQELNNKNYSLRIDENTEDELSKLKKEIYQITVLLKEQADNSLSDKIEVKDLINHCLNSLQTLINQKQIFTRFYKDENSSDESMGVGLSLAKIIVEKGEGSIMLKSAENEGSVFDVRYLK